MLDTARLLLELGADVNAVALNDVMPLNLAYALADSSDGYKQDMVNLLIKRWLAICNVYASSMDLFLT